MPPTTSDRFFALADRVEAALSGVGIPAELTGALRSYWEQPTAPRLAVLVETANRLLFVPINEGTLDRIHPAILAYRAIDDAVGVFYDNDHPDAHTAATAHLDQCERLLARDALLPVRLVGGVWISADPAVASPIKDDPFTPTSPRTDADPRLPTWRPLLCFPDPVVFSDVVLPPRPATDYARAFAEYNPADFEEEQRPSPFAETLLHATVNPDDWREFVEAHQDPITVERDPATGETTVSFDAEATCPGEEPIPVRAVVTYTPPRRIFAALHPCGYLYALGDTEDEARKSALSRRDINRDEARGVGLDFPPPETDEAWSADLVFVTVSGTTKSLRVYVESVDEVIPWCPADLWDSGEVTP